MEFKSIKPGMLVVKLGEPYHSNDSREIPPGTLGYVQGTAAYSSREHNDVAVDWDRSNRIQAWWVNHQDIQLHIKFIDEEL